MMEERRRHPRHRVLRRAKIVFRGGHSSVDVVLLDLSDGGARFRSPGFLAIPEIFELRIENGPVYEATVAFRSSAATGVRFLGAA